MNLMHKQIIALAIIVSALAMLVSGAIASSPESNAVPWQSEMLLETKVHDLDRSIEFYTQKLGFELELQIEEFKWARFITPSGIILGMSQVEPGQPTGSGALSLNITVPDTDDARAMLEARGVQFIGDTYTIPGIVRLATFSDPDGNRFKLAGPPSPGQPAR
jgi:predicted enzyme related to lactoylglutathione lyase